MIGRVLVSTDDRSRAGIYCRMIGRVLVSTAG